VKYVEELIQEPDLNLKVIVLVRDPRGVMKSRSAMPWCDQPTCSDIHSVCKNLDSDASAALSIGDKYPKRLLLIRYEDLSINPYDTVEKIIEFLDIPPRPEYIDKYLATHTGKERDEDSSKTKNNVKELSNPYGTKRLSSETTAFKWRFSMEEEMIKSIEETCQVPMEKLGYAKYSINATNEEILFKSPAEIWPL
jgi:hypothetical protein